jgi:hypothetical protein
MKTITRAFGAALALAAALAQQGCDNSYGIFQEVQKEREQKGQEIFKKKAVSDIVAFGGTYYASTAMVYTRAAAAAIGSLWEKLPIDGESDYFVYGLAATDTHVYASIAVGNSYAGVYALDSDTRITAPADIPGGEGLFVANNQLFLSCHAVDGSDPAQSTYTLRHYNGTIFETVANFSPASDKAIRGVAWDGTYYYFAAEDRLVRATNPDGSGLDVGFVDFAKTPRSATTGLYGAYIGTTDGYLYRYSNGSPESAAVTTIPVTAAVEVPLNGTTWQLLVGTGTASTSKDSLGYFESASDAASPLPATFTSGEGGAVATGSSIYSTTVGDLAVNAFCYDGGLASGTILIGLSSYTSSGIHFGLYASKWDAGSWSGWKAE